MKKLAIIGKGTAGVLSALHFIRHTDWVIDFYYDSGVKPQAVGEGSLPGFPAQLYNNANFNTFDLLNVDGTLKTGIYKENWGNKHSSFFHHFYPGQVGYHFNAVKLQQYIFNHLENNRRVTIIDKHVDSYDSIDADFIMDCSGKPADYSNYYTAEYIPVNSVYVTQCFWDSPKFQYTLSNAEKHGWYFGIPLMNRCSIGYMYNNSISSLDEIKEDALKIIQTNNLIPSDTTSSFSFNNYYHKNNYSKRVVYNGNASFFLEPLEATSIGIIENIQRKAFDVWNGIVSPEDANKEYLNFIIETETMIMLHYSAGSKFNSNFWDFAEKRGTDCIEKAMTTDKFKNIIDLSYQEEHRNLFYAPFIDSYSTWTASSFHQNIEGLGLKDNLKKYL
jgi:tryptophan halogenase